MALPSLGEAFAPTASWWARGHVRADAGGSFHMFRARAATRRGKKTTVGAILIRASNSMRATDFHFGYFADLLLRRGRRRSRGWCAQEPESTIQQWRSTHGESMGRPIPNGGEVSPILRWEAAKKQAAQGPCSCHNGAPRYLPTTYREGAAIWVGFVQQGRKPALSPWPSPFLSRLYGPGYGRPPIARGYVRCPLISRTRVRPIGTQ